MNVIQQYFFFEIIRLLYFLDQDSDFIDKCNVALVYHFDKKVIKSNLNSNIIGWSSIFLN